MSPRHRALLSIATVALAAGAIAAPPARAATQRTTTATFSPTTLLTGSLVQVKGKVTRTPKGSVVQIQRKSGAKWTRIASTRTTTAKGAYALHIRLATSGTLALRAYAPKKGARRAAASKAVSVRVLGAVPVSLTSTPTTILSGGFVVLSGKVSLVPAGTQLALQRQDGATWTNVAMAVTTATGAFSTNTPVPAAAGTYALRAYVPASSGRPSGTSSPVSVTVTAPPPSTPVITSPKLADGTVGTTYADQLITLGNAVGTWAITAGAMPAGLGLSSSGAVTGTPTSPGNTSVEVTFTQASNSQAAVATYVVHVDPTPPAVPTTPATVSAGGDHTCSTKPDHTLWCWGDNQKDQLGVPFVFVQPWEPAPVQVGNDTDWATVSATGWAHTCATKADYSLWCWGYNFYGEVGVGHSGYVSAPTQVGIGTNWAEVSLGYAHTCATTTAGRLWCWGGNGTGQLGNVTAPDDTVPVPVGTDTDWASVSAGANHTCALKTNQTIWCWGGNFQGQLGTGGTTSTYVPGQVGAATDWASVSAGNGATCARKTSGALWCWGKNVDGRVGDGSSGTDRHSPVQVGTDTDWAQVDTSGAGNPGHSCARKTGGTLWCWGDNGSGDLGDGNAPTGADAPVQVGADTDWASVTIGGEHTCAIKTDDTEWCWGSDSLGQLGNGYPQASQDSPAKVN